jgi:hypothetical protein
VLNNDSPQTRINTVFQKGGLKRVFMSVSGGILFLGVNNIYVKRKTGGLSGEFESIKHDETIFARRDV